MSVSIEIKNGYYARKIVNGVYPQETPFKEYTESSHKSGYAKTELGYTGTVYVMMEGRKREVHVNPSLITQVSSQDFGIMSQVNNEPTESDLENLSKQIADRFLVMDISCNAIVKGIMRGLVISGAPGVGKTYLFEKELQKAEDEGQITSFLHVKGKMSPLFLYETLYNNREEGSIVLLDDTDSVFEDPTALNILKAALDTSSGWVSWGSTTRYLADNDIPANFQFNGSIVFITNYDFDRMINANNKMAPHFKALASRTTYLDLKIHTNLEIMLRVQQVALDSGLLESKGISVDVAKEMIQWMWDNYNTMRELSIRSLLKLVEYNEMGDWKFLAENFMLLD